MGKVSKLNKRIAAICMGFVLMLSFASCGSKGGFEDVLASGTPSDLSGYEGMIDYDKDSMLVDMTVEDMDKRMSDGESFVVLFSYEDCPYCNRLLPYFNDAAIDAGVHVGYINTRRNPEWESNMDIDGYDTVVERFGEWLEKDEDGRQHLYTPDAYFIKNGKVVSHHDGVTPGADDPNAELTSEQEKTLKSNLAEEFESIK